MCNSPTPVQNISDTEIDILSNNHMLQSSGTITTTKMFLSKKSIHLLKSCIEKKIRFCYKIAFMGGGETYNHICLEALFHVFILDIHLGKSNKIQNTEIIYMYAFSHAITVLQSFLSDHS